MFSEILQRVVEEAGGGIGAVLMGYDGIAIDQYFVPDEEIDLQMVVVEYSNVLKEIRKTAEILSLGDMEEISIRTDRFYIVIRVLNDEYFLAMLLNRDGNFGKGRYLMTRESSILLEALR
ncbi:MAG: roadblock/LC7 domain-containing protein [Desulfuromonadales bacterium]|nr:roadblock/LC7 domain-containing protein [Desulfuromonadales bacterium]